MPSSYPMDDRNTWLGHGVSFLSADRQPCPVCGHPTGDCTGEAPEAPAPRIQFTPLEKPSKDDPTVLVTEDIWEEVQITSLTKTRVLVARAGSYLPLAKAREYGLA